MAQATVVPVTNRYGDFAAFNPPVNWQRRCTPLSRRLDAARFGRNAGWHVDRNVWESKLVDVEDAVQDVSRNDCAHRRRSTPTAAYFARTLRVESCRLDEVPLGDHILFLVSHDVLAPAQ